MRRKSASKLRLINLTDIYIEGKSMKQYSTQFESLLQDVQFARERLGEIDRFSPQYEDVIGRYLKNLMNLRLDYEHEEMGFDTSVITVDFSELFLYMYQTRTARSDLQLVNYLFSEELARDYTYTMLPPAITELRLYHERLVDVTGKYQLPEKPTYHKDLMQLQRKFGDLHQKEATIDIEKVEREYDEVLKLWRKVCAKMNTFTFVPLMTTEYGSRFLLDESHRRLVHLFREDVLRSPSTIDILKDFLKKMTSNDAIFWDVIKALMLRRSRVRDYPSNLVDAEHAAIDYDFNKKSYQKEGVMNIYTGSPAPLAVFEEYLCLPKRDIPPLVRCPIYLMIRTFCANELASSQINTIDFLNAGIRAVIDLANAGRSPQILISELYNRLKDMSKARKIEFLDEKTAHYQIIFDTFRMNHRFSEYFDDALRAHFFNASYSKKWDDDYHTHGLEAKLKTLEMIETASQILKDQKDYEEQLARTTSKIYKNICELYTFYIEMLQDVDFSRLSPLMREHYDLLVTHPEETTSFG